MEKIARYLLEIKAVKLSPTNPFTWTSGMKSPIYCDNRKLLSFPHIRSSVIDGMMIKSKMFGQFDLIGGVVTAGLPHAAILADKMGLPLIYVRSSSKSHGLHNRIEGDMSPGRRVLLIEDLISTGGSCIDAALACREAGLEVAGVLAIFTYELPISRQRFVENKLKDITLTTFSELVAEAKEMAYINDKELDLLRTWKENPDRYVEQLEESSYGHKT